MMKRDWPQRSISGHSGVMKLRTYCARKVVAIFKNAVDAHDYLPSDQMKALA
jgi:hypothetical protein